MTSTWEIGGKTVASLQIHGKEVQSIIRNSDNAVLYELTSDIPILSVSASPNSISTFESSTVTATLTYNGSPMEGETVTFVDSDENTSTETTDENGQATYTFATGNVGTGSVTVSSNDITRVVSITVVKGDTDLAIDVPLNLVYSDAFNITGTLTGSDDSVLASKTVKLKVGNTVVATGTTNGSGVVSFTQTPVSTGNHSFQLVYDGDSSTNACYSSVVSREVGKESTILSIASPHGTLSPYYSDGVIPIMGSLWDNDGTGLENKDIVLSNRGTYLKTITTGSNGAITGNLNELGVGSHTINFDFGGDENYSASSVTKMVNIVNHSYSLTASVDNTTPSVGSSVTITGVLKKDNVVWSGQTLTIYDGATSLGTVTTDSSGAYSKEITGLSVGSHSLKASHSTVDSTSVSVTVSEVQSYSLSLTGDSVIEIGDSASVVATLSSGGSGVSGETLSYTIEHDSIVLDSGTGTTDSNGQIKIPYQSIGVGDITVSVSYGNNLTETYELEDCIYYNSNGFSNTGSTKTTTQITGLTLPTNFKCTFIRRFNSSTRYAVFHFGSDANNGIRFGQIGSTAGGTNKVISGTETSINYQNNVFTSTNTDYTVEYTYDSGTNTLKANSNTITGSYTDSNRSYVGVILEGGNSFREIKIKPLSHDLILYSNKKILSQADSESTKLTAYTTQGSGQTVTMKVYDSTQTTLLDTLTVTDDGDGYYSATYTANGYGDVIILCECGLLQETYKIEDCTYYIPNPTACTSCNIDLPTSAEVSFKMSKPTTSGGSGGVDIQFVDDSNHTFFVGNWSSDGANGLLIRNTGSASNLVSQTCTDISPNTEYLMGVSYNNGAWTYYTNNEVKTTTANYTPKRISRIDVNQGYMKELKIKDLSHGLGLELTSSTPTIETGNNTSVTATLTNGGIPIPNETLSYEIKHNSTTIDSGTDTTDSNGQISIPYTGTGVGDVDVIVRYGSSLQETLILEDNILYRSQEYSCTKSTGTVKQEWADALTSVDLPQWFELSFEYKTTGAINGEEHRLFFMPRTLFVQDTQPSTAMLVGNTECNIFQFGVRRDGTKLSESNGTLTCNEYHTIKIRRDGTKGSDVQNIISFYLDNTYLDYWGLPLAHNYTDWWFCFHLWRNGTVSIRNIKLKEL